MMNKENLVRWTGSTMHCRSCLEGRRPMSGQGRGRVLSPRPSYSRHVPSLLDSALHLITVSKHMMSIESLSGKKSYMDTNKHLTLQGKTVGTSGQLKSARDTALTSTLYSDSSKRSRPSISSSLLLNSQQKGLSGRKVSYPRRRAFLSRNERAAN